MAGAYEGIRVVDLSQGMAGSYAAMLVAEMGADVVKVEPPQGNPLRGLPAFHVWNRSKRGIVAEVSGEGRGVVQRLLAGAEVVIADFLPREARELHLTYEEVEKTNPRVIYCSMPPMGSRGPWADVPMNDDLVAAYAGIMAAQWGYREGPVYVVVPQSSYGAALLAAGAIGAALFARERTGTGQQLEVSWLAGSLAIQSAHLTASEPPEESPYILRDPLGGFTPCYRLYKASDDWLCIGAGTAVFWNKLCLALGVPEMISDPRYANAPLGIPAEHRPALKKTIAEIISTKTLREWLDILRENDVPCALVMTREEFINHPQVVHNGMREEIDDPELGKTIQMGVPVKLSKTPGAIRGPAPQLGQHTEEVLGELGGSSQPRPAAARLLPEGPLSGIQVVDFTTFYAGGGVGRLLAEMGAEVVKVEGLDGDPLRQGTFSFVAINRGKRSISIDLKKQEGRDIIHRLIQGADILVENFRPGTTKRFNIDYETVRQINPGIVYCSVTAFGREGPYGTLPGFDPLIQAMSGMMRAQGGKGNEPVYLRGTITDHACPLSAAYGILAALYHRPAHGGRAGDRDKPA